MDIQELYNRYKNTYEIELRECSSSMGVKLLKELHLLEDLTIEEFEERLKDSNFKQKWGDLEM
jgi:hypothetical protein